MCLSDSLNVFVCVLRGFIFSIEKMLVERAARDWRAKSRRRIDGGGEKEIENLSKKPVLSVVLATAIILHVAWTTHHQAFKKWAWEVG